MPEVTEARVIGTLQDGTPPPAEAPKPEFIVPAEDILASKTQQEGGREITIRKIKPIDLPLPPGTAPAPAGINAAFQARVDARRVEQPGVRIVQIGATVYRPHGAMPRTFATYWPGGEEEPVTFWSSADFSLLSGFSTFVDSEGEKCNLMMTWSALDWPCQSPEIPESPDGRATFVIVSGNASAESLATIQSLHDLHHNDYQKLKAAYDGREQARLAREAELEAHPPQPKNIILNYWRTERPSAVKGGLR